MPYEPDLRDGSWKGARDHDHTVVYDPDSTRAYNDEFRRKELARAEESRLKEEAARAARDRDPSPRTGSNLAVAASPVPAKSNPASAGTGVPTGTSVDR
jgi:hypothetical protein